MYEYIMTRPLHQIKDIQMNMVGGDSFKSFKSKEFFSIYETKLAEMAKSITATQDGRSSYKVQAGMTIP